MTSKNKEPYIICLDPDSGQIYSLGLISYDIHIEKDLPPKIKEKAKNTIKQLSFLRDASTTKWWFRSEEAYAYRRRKLLSYLIHQDCSKYPTFEAHSSLSLAFADVNSIKVTIDLSEYYETITAQVEEHKREKLLGKSQNMSHTDDEKDSEVSYNASETSKLSGTTREIKMPPKEIKLNISLVTGILSASEIIRNLLSILYKEYGVKLKPHNDQVNRFVLKVHGFREYLMSHVPLLAYDRVRESLRGLKNIQVVLTEISNISFSDTFPQIVERDVANVKKGIYDPIDWKKYEDAPLFMWYPPIELPDSRQAKDLLFQYNEEKNPYSKYKQITIEEEQFTTPNFSEKQKSLVKKFDNAKVKKNCVYTGEIDIPFKVRVCAIENLQAILTQFDEGATDNGFVTPSYITRTVARKDDAHGAQGKKKKEKKKKDGLIVKKLGKQKKDLFVGSLQHGDHGANGQLYNNLYRDGEFTILPYVITVEVSLYYGCNLLRADTIAEVSPVPFSFEPRWYKWVSFGGLLTSQLPKETRVCFNVKIHAPNGESQVIATVTHKLFNMFNQMKQGLLHLNLWPFYKTESRFVCQEEFWFLTGKGIPPKEAEAEAFRNSEYARLVIQLPTYCAPIFWSLRDSTKFSLTKDKDNILKRVPTSQELAQLQNILNRDPLNWTFNQYEREILIACRHHYKTIPGALPIFLSAINWSNPEEVAEAHLMLKIWAPMSPEDAVTLLDARFPDSEVRLYAIERVSEMSDDDLLLYLLELTQALVYENHHFSPLGEFLLERSLANPFKIGHEFYWMLRSQLHVKPSFERNTLMMEQFLMLCGSFRQELQDEIIVNDMVTEIAGEVPRMDKALRLVKARERIASLKQQGLPPEFTVSLDTRMRGTEFIAEECKVMDSKKLPLWLTIRNSQPGGRSIKIIFKTGDDLKQDQLTLQLIRIMDKIWLDNGLDLRMKPYRVLSTADQAGMLEVVLDSETTSDIHTKFGGGAIGAFNKKSIQNYIAKWNTDPESFANAKENFIRSCAGYAVATYCLGIGDRHSGNIMLTKSGHLFHIDFGHFLGNFKSKFGIKRERTAFVFTEEMAFVMGGRGSEDFEKFQDYCTKAYNLIRKRGGHLISLFIMMIIAGMPELSQYSDIDYLKNQLSLDLSELEATNKFINEIHNSLNSTFRRIDNLFHALKRG